jgi:tRNA isopentenyl-2-thiomethyl-A-37 hydroxylase MiaE
MENAGMVALQIRDVPDDVRDTLAELARVRGQSLQAFLLSIVVSEARRSANAALLARFSERSDGSRLAPAEIVTALEEARSNRDAQLAARLPADNRRT